VDTTARIVAAALTDLWGHQVIIENRPGAAGSVGTEVTAKAPPDGYTLMLCQIASHAITPARSRKPTYDHINDFAFPSMIGSVPKVFMMHPSMPAKNLKQFIAFAKAHPGRLNIGQSGAGSLTHLLAARLGHEAGISMVQIQYRGGTPALLDVMAGTADLYFSLLPESLPHIRDAKLRPIAFASPERNPNLPEVSLVSDVLPGFVGDTAYGLVVAAGIPPEWIAFWNAAVNGFMNRPEVRERMRALLWVPVNSSPEAYRGEIARDRETWGGVIRAADIRSGS
jgi:tripartite-type tricarboxylate transporter receptor subunit TctC